MPPRELCIEPASPADIPAVLALWDAARSDHAVTPDSAGSLERLLGHDPGSLLLARRRAELLGTVIAGWDGWRGGLYRLVVIPAARREGTGRALVAAAEARLRSRGATRITALVAFEDDGANRFWQAAGYPADSGVGRRVRNL